MQNLVFIIPGNFLRFCNTFSIKGFLEGIKLVNLFFTLFTVLVFGEIRKLFILLSSFNYLYCMGEFSMRDAIQKFLDQSRIKGDIQALQIEDVWSEIMGKTVARYTDKLQIIGDRLIITTQVAPLRHELIYQKEKIRQRVNEALGKNVIKEIVVQ